MLSRSIDGTSVQTLRGIPSPRWLACIIVSWELFKVYSLLQDSPLSNLNYVHLLAVLSENILDCFHYQSVGAGTFTDWWYLQGYCGVTGVECSPRADSSRRRLPRKIVFHPVEKHKVIIVSRLANAFFVLPHFLGSFMQSYSGCLLCYTQTYVHVFTTCICCWYVPSDLNLVAESFLFPSKQKICLIYGASVEFFDWCHMAHKEFAERITNWVRGSSTNRHHMSLPYTSYPTYFSQSWQFKTICSSGWRQCWQDSL